MSTILAVALLVCFGGGFVTIAGLIVGAWRRRSRLYCRRYMRDLDAESITYIERPTGLVGTLNSLQWRLHWPRTGLQSWCRLEVFGAPPTVSAVAMQRWNYERQRGAYTLPGPRALTGDEQLDQAVVVTGESATVSSLLNAPTRELLRGTCADRNARIEMGCVEVMVKPDTFIDTLRLVADLIHHLQPHYAEVEPQLLDNFRADPVPETRLVNLRHLLRSPASELATQAAQEAVQGNEARSFLEAARYLGDFDALMRVLNDTALPADLRVDALATLVQQAPRDLAIQATTAGLSSQDTGLVEAALDTPTAADAAHLDALAQLSLWVMHTPSWQGEERAQVRVGCRTARTLMRVGVSANSILFGLTRHTNPKIAAEAARSIGGIGTIDDIPLLQQIALDAPRSVAEAAERSILAIQHRVHGGQGAGWVSLPSDLASDIGAVSLTNAPHVAGAISLPSENPELANASEDLPSQEDEPTVLNTPVNTTTTSAALTAPEGRSEPTPSASNPDPAEHPSEPVERPSESTHRDAEAPPMAEGPSGPVAQDIPPASVEREVTEILARFADDEAHSADAPDDSDPASSPT